MLDVLSYLMDRPGSWVSGEEMASSLGISRAAVWKQIQILRSRGYSILSSTRKGYLLAQVPDILDRRSITRALETGYLGRELHYQSETSSTNDLARSVVGSARNGAVVLSEIQTSGRGRLGREWLSPRGGVWMSLILKPNLPPALAPRINMAVGVALARTLSELYGLQVGIKWPNDLLVGEKKVCGILTEISAEMDRLNYVVVGVGINANLDGGAFPGLWNATSLQQELGRRVSREELIVRFLKEAERSLEDMTSDLEKVRQEWCLRSSTLNRLVRIELAGEELVGTARSIDQEGALLIETEEGTMRRVLAGDCIHLRPVKRDDQGR
ncbi:MAG: biotin--[acetyl-CoA-carboxylase] ligase [Methanosarcinales archaeon]|nr:biotin--[acetyl-CoA-carboxylase] ligase [Methanosarcinales archaeon]